MFQNTMVQEVHRSSLNTTFDCQGFHHLVDHRAPKVSNLLVPSNTVVPQVHSLTLKERCLMGSLIMSLLASASGGQQLLMSIFKSKSKSGLVFRHPFLYLTRQRVQTMPQEPYAPRNVSTGEEVLWLAWRAATGANQAWQTGGCSKDY